MTTSVMSEEERLVLEHEGRAALSEMGEFVPDPDDAILQAEIDEPFAPLPPAENFRILDDDLGTGGAKEKFWRNIKAIATLKQIETEGRNATPGGTAYPLPIRRLGRSCGRFRP